VAEYKAKLASFLRCEKLLDTALRRNGNSFALYSQQKIYKDSCQSMKHFPKMNHYPIGSDHDANL